MGNLLPPPKKKHKDWSASRIDPRLSRMRVVYVTTEPLRSVDKYYALNEKKNKIKIGEWKKLELKEIKSAIFWDLTKLSLSRGR